MKISFFMILMDPDKSGTQQSAPFVLNESIRGDYPIITVSGHEDMHIVRSC